MWKLEGSFLIAPFPFLEYITYKRWSWGNLYGWISNKRNDWINSCCFFSVRVRLLLPIFLIESFIGRRRDLGKLLYLDFLFSSTDILRILFIPWTVSLIRSSSTPKYASCMRKSLKYLVTTWYFSRREQVVAFSIITD